MPYIKNALSVLTNYDSTSHTVDNWCQLDTGVIIYSNRIGKLFITLATNQALKVILCHVQKTKINKKRLELEKVVCSHPSNVK